MKWKTCKHAVIERAQGEAIKSRLAGHAGAFQWCGECGRAIEGTHGVPLHNGRNDRVVGHVAAYYIKGSCVCVCLLLAFVYLFVLSRKGLNRCGLNTRERFQTMLLESDKTHGCCASLQGLAYVALTCSNRLTASPGLEVLRPRGRRAAARLRSRELSEAWAGGPAAGNGCRGRSYDWRLRCWGRKHFAGDGVESGVVLYMIVLWKHHFKRHKLTQKVSENLNPSLVLNLKLSLLRTHLRWCFIKVRRLLARFPLSRASGEPASPVDRGKWHCGWMGSGWNCLLKPAAMLWWKTLGVSLKVTHKTLMLRESASGIRLFVQ